MTQPLRSPFATDQIKQRAAIKYEPYHAHVSKCITAQYLIGATQMSASALEQRPAALHFLAATQTKDDPDTIASKAA